MIVSLKTRRASKTFEEIVVGECFMYAGDVYLKISDDLSRDNVFNFYDDCIATVFKDSLVIPLNMELIEVR